MACSPARVAAVIRLSLMHRPTGPSLRLGLIAPKNSTAEIRWLLSHFCHVFGEPYQRGRRYDLVWFLNVTEELRFIKVNTDAKTFVVGIEPALFQPQNSDPHLLALAHRYSSYANLAGGGFRGVFVPFTFPVAAGAEIRREMPASLQSLRDHEFCLFASHDPNTRRAIGSALAAHRAILAGRLFQNPVDAKLPVQRRCRFEFITENTIDDHYISEKLGQSLLAGCVPVYYGCTRVKETYPADLFVDMHDFPGPDGLPDFHGVIRHCLAPGVYERYRNAIAARAMTLLLERFTTEHCLIEPVQQYADELRFRGWGSHRRTWLWFCWHVRSLLFPTSSRRVPESSA